MRLADVKRRNRAIGVALAVVLVYATGLDGLLRRLGGPLFLLACLIPLFVLAPVLVEWLERKIVR